MSYQPGRHFLQIPGPTNVPDRVLRAIDNPTIDHRSADFAKFEARIRAVNEITECYLVSGGYDYLLKFVMRSINHYQETIEELLATGIGIEKYFSYVVIKPVFVKQHLDLSSYFPIED